MSDNKGIIGMYKRNSFSSKLIVDTPDPTKYHDVDSIHLSLGNTGGLPVSSKMPGSHGYGGLRGVVIPRATARGGSLGHNHMQPRVAYIDPEQTGGKLILDPAKIANNPHKMVEAIQRANAAGFDDPDDVTLSAYSEFIEASQQPSVAHEISLPQTTDAPPVPRVTPPLNTPNLYVVDSTPANFTAKPALPPQPAFANPRTTATSTTDAVSAAMAMNTASMVTAAPITVQAMRSLRSEFGSATVPASIPALRAEADPRRVRRVTFEIPMPGGGSLGQFNAYYHAVLKGDGILVLVYDHRYPTQLVYFPPELEDPHSKEPIAIAMLVEGIDKELNMLYLVYSTGIRFKYGDEEFAILTVETAKPDPR